MSNTLNQDNSLDTTILGITRTLTSKGILVPKDSNVWQIVR